MSKKREWKMKDKGDKLSSCWRNALLICNNPLKPSYPCRSACHLIEREAGIAKARVSPQTLDCIAVVSVRPLLCCHYFSARSAENSMSYNDIRLFFSTESLVPMRHEPKTWEASIVPYQHGHRVTC